MEISYVTIDPRMNVELINEAMIDRFGPPVPGPTYIEYIPVTTGDPDQGILPLYEWAIRVPDGVDPEIIRGALANLNLNGKTKREKLRDNVFQLYQTAVGVRVQDLTTAQLKSVLVVLLYQSGMIDENLRVLPLLDTNS